MFARIILPAFLWLLAAYAEAETLTLAGGQTIRSSTTGHDSYRAEINLGWNPEVWRYGSWALSLNHAFSVTTFRDRNNVNAVSWAPNLIFSSSAEMGVHTYVQFGIGIAYLSEDEFKSEPKMNTMYPQEGTTDMGTHWQFESSLAIGLVKGAFGARVKVYHYSNADLGDKNEGMDVAEFGFSYSF